MAIYLKDVIFEFETHRVIDQITLNVSEQRIGIVGVNGSGKSTLARLISGLIAPISGSIRINDIDIYKDRKAALKTVGIIFQNPDHQIIFPTCIEEISFGLMQQGMTRIEAEERSNEILLQFDRLKWSDQLAHNLSQGQRHFLCLIAVLAMKPDVIILDEPYAGLDLPTAGEITIGGAVVFSEKSGAFVHPSKRNLGLVFQSYALWPHLTVKENIIFGLEISGSFISR